MIGKVAVSYKLCRLEPGIGVPISKTCLKQGLYRAFARIMNREVRHS